MTGKRKPVIREYTVESSRVTDTVRLILLADYHDSDYGAEQELLVERVAELSPDAVLMAGDMADCLRSHERVQQLTEWLASRYPCYAVSAETGEHVDEIRSLLKDKITVLSGLSGVGKSSLVNCIEPGLDLKTAGISDAHDSGKHTTTFAEMFPLKQGGFIIDTPGLRSFGIIDLKKEELSHFFPEIFAKSGECRFYNCTHTHEPGCAVLEAVEQDEISESRYVSYLSMMEESGKYR